MTKRSPTIEVPYFNEITDVINKHLGVVDNDSPPTEPSVNDEIEILINLMGLSRIIEYNMRVGFEKFNTLNNLGLTDPDTFNDLINALEPYIVEKNRIEVLHYVRKISNGLVHSDFKKVYINSKNAYEIDDIGFHYEKFDPPIVYFQSTITKNGLHITVTGDDATAKDSKGNEIPTKTLKPDGTNEIDIDFKFFYLTGSFIFTYDILYTAYKFSVNFKEEMKHQKSKSNNSLNKDAP